MRYQILREMEPGKLLHVASRRSMEEARLLVQQLDHTFPGHYVVRERKIDAEVKMGIVKRTSPPTA